MRIKIFEAYSMHIFDFNVTTYVCHLKFEYIMQRVSSCSYISILRLNMQAPIRNLVTISPYLGMPRLSW